MTQLTKDSQSYGDKLLKLETVIKKIKSNIKSHHYTETIKIKNSLNRIFADEIRSNINVPAYSNSAVDGYAINYNEYSHGNREFNIIGKSSAGHPFKGKINKLTSVR